jgi:hypothetical protein
LAARIHEAAAPGILRVGIDGVDGAGKTSLADKKWLPNRAGGKGKSRRSV